MIYFECFNEFGGIRGRFLRFWMRNSVIIYVYRIHILSLKQVWYPDMIDFIINIWRHLQSITETHTRKQSSFIFKSVKKNRVKCYCRYKKKEFFVNLFKRSKVLIQITSKTLVIDADNIINAGNRLIFSGSSDQKVTILTLFISHKISCIQRHFEITFINQKHEISLYLISVHI